MDFHGRGSGGAGGVGPDPALIMDQARACAQRRVRAVCSTLALQAQRLHAMMAQRMLSSGALRVRR
jgi:hypothetical protein